ncbi:kinesin-domain-containing protein [Metschnikowia bicuspidata var. bicuspidata NRRL YB-4993]|uniref:Kinesin-like protein n=1 Tax=Metschnikowia bicuspidata var. bicuspidata NRRL YB-4993 TaxID=869754 RepID=A0A1A0H7B3_9ASCO|nr:kinesin-domain-containing protein [Metschnikowia bicuspidata var. bicuspidata NRRL YB-4993]OBA19787.1 kinesin-domain-containing protein [Metschnikowia bicuspidata var. bicuspidata NRRL YB-4993]
MSDNIQVVVRCRARNRQEIAAKSPAIVDLPNDEHSADEPFVTITNDTASTLSGLGRSLPTTGKIFKVDQVYGPNADQALLFDNVAMPLFHDFISGLNVTILAYGQTGSGKTYSMCGDLTGENSGIMPRVLSKLFNSIDTDYMVKISCVELYKEELHDLINNEFDLAPFKSKLRLGPSYTNDKQSTVIHNLTEMHIDSCEMGFNILKQCLERRKTSATKLNDISSRSHTIFSINLFRKKSLPTGSDEYIKSTMNLVDLAGSEDINKSGATNERAREAGSINQSLLALGKVISALSEGKDSKHVPYRESKLTRILQGSIGGHTKTALIATISPAKINAFETVSTLNYASKAKNIRNLPQSISDSDVVNKKVLIKDLSSRIARLERDRISAADKDNHVKISVQTYKDFCNASTEYETTYKEKDAQITKLSSKLEAKTIEESMNQEIIASLQAQLDELRQECALKSSALLKLQEEVAMKETLTTKREQTFTTAWTNLQSRFEDIIADASSFVAANSSSLTENLESKQNKIVDFWKTSLNKLNEELNIFLSLFGPGWKQDLTQQLKEDLDFSKDAEKIRVIDFGSDLSHFKDIEEQVQGQIENSLLLKSHEGVVNANSEKVAHDYKKLKEGLLIQMRNALDLTFNAHQDAICNAIKANATQVLSDCASKTSEAMGKLSKGHTELYKSIEARADEHSRNVTTFKNKLDRKMDGAGARIYDETKFKINRGVQSLIQSNLEHGTNSVELLEECFSETKALMSTSNETFKCKLEGAKDKKTNPLSEIKDINIPRVSPKRKSSSISLRSPQRYDQLDFKRKKLLALGKTDSEISRSQIPQLQIGRK